MDSRRSHVMNDDILGLIFNELNVKQLLRLESVCNQFMDCISRRDSSLGSALQRKTALRIGSIDSQCNKEYHSFKEGDISDAIVRKSVLFDLFENKDTLDSILGKCFNIKCLYLKNNTFDAQIISLITTRCPQLKSLYLDFMFVKGLNKGLMHSWIPLFSRLSHLTLKNKIDVNIIQLLPQLSSLESIELNELYRCNYYIMDAMFEYLPQSIRCLKLKNMITSDNQLDLLVDRCPHLVALNLDEESIADWDQILPKICTHFKLKRLDIKFCENVAKLNEFRHLSLSGIDLNTNVTQSMPSLKSLRLNFQIYSPKMFGKLTQMYANVKHLHLNQINIKCECSEDIDEGYHHHQVLDCPQCVYKCMHSVSQLPQLKQLCIGFEYYNSWYIGSNGMKLFAELNVLSLKCNENIEELIAFVLHCIEYRVSKKSFKLYLYPIIVDSLIDDLNDMKVTIPKNIIIIKSNEYYI